MTQAGDAGCSKTANPIDSSQDAWMGNGCAARACIVHPPCEQLSLWDRALHRWPSWKAIGKKRGGLAISLIYIYMRAEGVHSFDLQTAILKCVQGAAKVAFLQSQGADVVIDLAHTSKDRPLSILVKQHVPKGAPVYTSTACSLEMRSGQE
eukprot:scaffold3923_cov15-Tisochrysis_lutea.AAC.1